VNAWIIGLLSERALKAEWLWRAEWNLGDWMGGRWGKAERRANGSVLNPAGERGICSLMKSNLSAMISMMKDQMWMMEEMWMPQRTDSKNGVFSLHLAAGSRSLSRSDCLMTTPMYFSHLLDTNHHSMPPHSPTKAKILAAKQILEIIEKRKETHKQTPWTQGSEIQRQLHFSTHILSIQRQQRPQTTNPSANVPLINTRMSYRSFRDRVVVD
jgi:hypothetical protein